MKWVADENIDLAIVERLRSGGHSVLHVAEMAAAAADRDVVEHAVRESAILLTSDKDFGELVFLQGTADIGVVLLRLAGIRSSEKAQIVASVVTDRASDLPGSFTVITRKKVRIRKRRT